MDMDLFESAANAASASADPASGAPSHAPLAEALRPRNFSDFVGQERVVASLSKSLADRGTVPNLIFWGPPGTGKTTLAQLIASRAQAEIIQVNAVEIGAKELRRIGQESHDRRLQFSRATILFIDEIHRLNKAQQDVLLPFTEKGDFSLIGATTENPSYELNAALLSRSRVIVFDRLSEEQLSQLLTRSATKLGHDLNALLLKDAENLLVESANGDARRLLNLFERIIEARRLNEGEFPLALDAVKKLMEHLPLYYDKHSAEHHDCISAFIKSIRGSDADAGLYYLARMLESGEDPTFIARRLVILASEDISNADPKALPLAVAGMQAVEMIGLPEAAINLAQVVTYLASAPKSNRSYLGLKKAQDLVRRTGNLPVPLDLRSSKTALSRSLGYGKDYEYAHDSAKGWLPQDYLPEALRAELEKEPLYEPSERGFEKTIKQYLEWLKG